LRPRRWHARIDAEAGSPSPEPQHTLDRGAIHPGGGARVPGPARAAGVPRAAVYVAGHHVRLAFVALDIAVGAGVVDWIQHVEQLGHLVTAPESGERHPRPHRRVRVLAAVFPDPRGIPLDVAWILGRAVERWVEQEQQL